jgi:hypothetical protein
LGFKHFGWDSLYFGLFQLGAAVPPLIFSAGSAANKFFHCPAQKRTQNTVMNKIIYPRSPRETMDGWHHLPRYIDKIRLHLAGRLSPDYQPNLGQGFDGVWLQAAGLTHEQFLAVVKNTLTDGEVCDWVHQNVKKSPAEKDAHWQEMLNRPRANDATAIARLQMRKTESNLAHRDDIRTFVDYIDADEKRI